MGVSQAVFKAYRERQDAVNAYNRAVARNAIRQFAQRDEATHGMSVQLGNSGPEPHVRLF